MLDELRAGRADVGLPGAPRTVGLARDRVRGKSTAPATQHMSERGGRRRGPGRGAWPQLVPRSHLVEHDLAAHLSNARAAPRPRLRTGQPDHAGGVGIDLGDAPWPPTARDGSTRTSNLGHRHAGRRGETRAARAPPRSPSAFQFFPPARPRPLVEGRLAERRQVQRQRQGARADWPLPPRLERGVGGARSTASGPAAPPSPSAALTPRRSVLYTDGGWRRRR